MCLRETIYSLPPSLKQRILSVRTVITPMFLFLLLPEICHVEDKLVCFLARSMSERKGQSTVCLFLSIAQDEVEVRFLPHL